MSASVGFSMPASAALGGIVTPEAVVLELDTAGVASRLLAALVDVFVYGVAYMLLAIVVTPIVGGDEGLAVTVFVVLIFTVLLVAPVVVQMVMRGRTVGKMAFGLRAVTVDGAPIRFRHAVLRTMGGLVDRFMPPGGITGVLFVLGTPRAQSVGDLLAGTIVIRDPERHRPPAAVWFPVPAGLEAFAATIDPSAITNEQYTVIRSFLLRTGSLSASARWSLADDLADRVSRSIGHVRPRGVHPEAFLLCAVARFQRRTFPAYQPRAWR